MGFQDNVNVDVRGAAHIAPCTYKTVVLKQNITKQNLNVLTQAMLDEYGPNTKFVIKWDYTLKTDITIPANCIMEFEGGSIDGNSHNVGFDNTYCKFADEKTGFTNCTFSGNLQNRDVYVDNYGASPSLNDNADILNNLFSLCYTSNITYQHVFIFGKGTYKITEPLELWFGYENKCEVKGIMKTSIIKQMTDNVPIVICHECCSLHDLGLFYDNAQPNTNTKAIAVAYSRLVLASIYNLYIRKAYTAIGCVVPVTTEDTQHPTVDPAIVNSNIHDINTANISGWFLNISHRKAGQAGVKDGVTSGMYMTNIYMGISHYSDVERGTCLGFAKFTGNSECTIGNINVEGGTVSSKLIQLSYYAMITVEHIHIEGVTLSGNSTFDIPAKSFLKINSLDFDYNTRYSAAYPFMFNMQGGEVIIDNLNLLDVEGGFSITTALWIIYAGYGNSSVAIINKVIGLPAGATLYREESTASCKLLIEGELNKPRNVGTTAQRPTLKPKDVGFQYFDTTLGKPIYYTAIIDEVIEIETADPSSFEFLTNNILTPGNTYYIVFHNNSGKFGYKNSSYAYVDMSNFINPEVETEFIAKDYPYFVAVKNAPSTTGSVYTKTYAWVDATGTPV